ncbi:ligase-associated DNA damage response endonuclease PdeM [Mangrovibrevibacter kandeliae]|uniref:ligase-associated DNA damage response endonuclease PdeM n=1 Tax=Mangrovibrevibacter kandeliae TaxID=2968473 RepID=UPI002118892A|nr:MULTISPECIES: ligase-associated DNA damage response endonuclease PdeM [unclassified Aurantimonas]MCQ8784194.1 ligase-associated DNA damage response endonuclease PdeM [Aurantimonas sp. CSK15Z-1]MCW4116964.1 ligase-associated DNA damage response endonuclease PdeM [Aurantimonas sp. MSK8Z-1]
MTMMLRRLRRVDCEPVEIELNGEAVLCDPAGVIVVPEHDLLVVSDLHLEKGAAFARRGMLLPPYDTAMTLALLESALERHRPKQVICLGDSFHDRHGAALMPAAFRETLTRLMAGRDWTWIAGNHDPEPPALIGGETRQERAVGGLVFRHEPTPAPRAGEIAGHLHPVARVSGGGRSTRGACFATDGSRLVMPSFGVTTGGLNVLDRAFHGLFRLEAAKAYVIGTSRIFAIGFAALARG